METRSNVDTKLFTPPLSACHAVVVKPDSGFPKASAPKTRFSSGHPSLAPARRRPPPAAASSPPTDARW